MVAIAAAALASVGAVARAGTAELFSQHDDFTPQPNRIGPLPPHRTLQFDTKTGHWGVNVDVAQPGDRDVQWRDAHIGVNYRVTPGFRTGVGFSLGGETPPDGRRLNPDGASPRVRLESTFKF
jgi:hypothetical protein